MLKLSDQKWVEVLHSNTHSQTSIMKGLYFQRMVFENLKYMDLNTLVALLFDCIGCKFSDSCLLKTMQDNNKSFGKLIDLCVCDFCNF